MAEQSCQRVHISVAWQTVTSKEVSEDSVYSAGGNESYKALNNPTSQSSDCCAINFSFLPSEP